MIDLDATYSRLARPWTHDQLAAYYDEANRDGAQTAQDMLEIRDRPISLLASAIPASTNLSVAIHTAHVLPAGARDQLVQQLVDTAAENAANVLHRCHLALELDGEAHGYAPGDWLALIYNIAAPILESAHLDQEPPSIVQHTHDAVRWLASAIINLDQDSPETPSTLAEVLARLLAIFVFARTAGS